MHMEQDNSSRGKSWAATNIPFSASDSLLWGALPDLKLNIAQTAALCGISVRQLGYWTKQGYVKAVGRGARRLYDLDALRQILSIRQAMHDGASLRQALRAIPASASTNNNAITSTPIKGVPKAEDAVDAAIPAHVSDAISSNLLFFFQSNRFARDNATGLAAKLGHSEEDIRSVAEDMCNAGYLTKAQAQGDAIFLYPEGLVS